MNTKQFAGLVGFAFAAAWIGLGFGDAILCLVGAAAFYAVGMFLEGEIQVADLQRLADRAGPPPAPPAARPRPASARPRVR